MSPIDLLNFPARKPIVATLIALMFTVAAAYFAMSLTPDVSLSGMISSNDSAAKALDSVFNHFSAVEEMLLLVTLPENSSSKSPDVEKLLSFANRFEKSCDADVTAASQVASINFRADARTRDFVEKIIGPNAIFYLSDAEFTQAQQRLSREGIAEQFAKNEQMIAAPGPAAGAIARAFLQDPLRLHEFIISRLAAIQPIHTYQNSDAFLSPDGRSLLIRIAGKLPPGDIEFAKSFTKTIERISAAANKDHLRLDLSGAYPIAAHTAGAIRRDAIESVVTSIVTLGLLFGIVYRRPFRRFFLAMTPVIVGVLWGFGVYALVHPTITPLTAVIGGMLAGIGIDYTVHYLTQYHSRRAGRTASHATRETLRTIGTSLVGAWATSVIGFFAIAIIAVKMLRDFALAGTLGLGGAFLCTLILLPALLALFDRTESPEGDASRIDLASLVRGIERHRRICIGICFIIFIAPLAWFAFDHSVMQLESDLTVLHPKPSPPLDAERFISQRMGISPGSLLVYLHADSNAKLLEAAHQVRQRLALPEATDAGVTGTMGLASVLPDPAIVAQRIAATGPAYANRVLADFDAAVASSSFSPDAFAPYRSFLRVLLTPTIAPTVESLRPYPQFSELFLPKKNSDVAESIVLVSLKDSLEHRDNRDRSINALLKLLSDIPSASLTGVAVISQQIESTVQRDLPRLIGGAMALVCVYLLIHFRSPRDALLALLPSLFSLACVLGTMELLGQKLNLVNIISLPLLVGIDVDYGIFLVGVTRASRTRGELLQNLNTTAQAVIVCASATALGFGSVYFTSIPAIRSLGIAVAVGVVSCAGGAIFWLMPILLRTKVADE